MEYIDLKSWPRRELYRFYGRMDYPHFNICADADITRLHAFLRDNSISIFKTILFGVSKAANGIPEFRLRIRGNRVVAHEVVHPSYTVLGRNNLFGFCETRYTDTIASFFTRAEKDMQRARSNPVLTDTPGRDDYLFISSLPWVSFTSVSHPIHMHPADSVPRISWGKYKHGRHSILMPLSVQIHHGLADGFHVGKFFECFQEWIDRPEEIFDREDAPGVQATNNR
jgi:chloramphenicol O-acetyltransferase type A